MLVAIGKPIAAPVNVTYVSENFINVSLTFLYGFFFRFRFAAWLLDFAPQLLGLQDLGRLPQQLRVHLRRHGVSVGLLQQDTPCMPDMLCH